MNLKTCTKVLLWFTIVLGAATQAFAQQDSFYDPPDVHDTSAGGKRALAIYRMVFRNNPPTPGGKVNDWEKILTAREERSLDSLLAQVKKAANVDIAVVTIDTVCIKTEKFPDISSRIADKWSVGKKPGKNGLLFSFSAGHGLCRLECGFGEERLITEQDAKLILDKQVYPLLTEGKYCEALAAGIISISELLLQRQQ